jgi:DME family drug/metabolite transporter
VHLFGLFGILAAAALWALVGVITKRLYGTVSITPLAVGAMRLALSAPALLAWSVAAERPSWRIARGHWLLLALYACAMAGYQLGFLGALTNTTVTAATLLLTTAPVFVTLLAFVFLRERPTGPRLLLLAVAVGGAALIIVGSSGAASPGGAWQTNSAALRGDALALCAALAYACYYLLSSVLGRRYGGIQVMGIAIAGGAVLLVPAAVLGGGLMGVVARLPVSGWALILVLALGCTALSYALYGAAMRRVPATLASVAALLEPAIASGLAWLLLGERLAPVGIAGGILLLCGIAGTYWLRARVAAS